MSRTYTKKKKNGGIPLKNAVTEESVKRQLAWATSSEQFKNRDPMFHITDNFMRNFDALGTMEAQKLAGAMKEEVPGLEGKTEKEKEKQEKQEKNSGLAEGKTYDEGGDAAVQELYMQSRMDPDLEFGGMYRSDQISKFSEMAFMRGKLSASVVNGGGKLFLFSCLKRTLGQSQPRKRQQRKLFMPSARGWKPQTGTEADESGTLFYRNQTFADSAVGLSIDVTKDARRTADLISDLILGGESGAETWEKMAPFLNQEKETVLLKNYRIRLKELGNDGEEEKQRKILERAVTRTETLLAKKKQLKEEFVFKLRTISQKAKDAEQMFSEMLASGEAEEAVKGTFVYPEPPEGNPPPEDEIPGAMPGGTVSGSGEAVIS